MESIPMWQGVSICVIVSWIVISSTLNVTQKLRSFIQPWVSRHVLTGTPLILQIQKFQHGFLDALFSGLSCVVSVPFYTAFLPLLFWDSVSAPRPSCPPVRRVTATKDEKENAMEYGLPSSHTLNTVCLSGYLLHYVLSYAHNRDAVMILAGVGMVCLLVALIGTGRIYLGMHSLVDIIGGLAIGLAILAFWLTMHEYVDNFIVSGQNVTPFWAALSLVLLFAYPTPEFPTPSYEFHTAFNGVALGIVSGIQQTYHQFHHEDVSRIFTPQLSIPAFIGRMLIGIPTILLVKFCSKALAKWILPVVSNTLGIPIRSTIYVPSLKGSVSGKKSDESKQLGYIQKLLFFSHQDSFDVDTGIRFLQYAGLAWSVVDLVPSMFSQLSL
ncbi:lipid phosphate phosphatase delta isoform X2 [Vitis riparia]|uniref:lipid phosphate phosphatase delta isoform X2 n=1 Tax=Vitis riparia TaxID=96939 RepID=UPI00155B37A5|nr:lipid phosphate phosphatase delta isoform X2 [Vitis riparia]